MHIRVGCEFRYTATFPTPAVAQVEPRPDAGHRIVTSSWGTEPDVAARGYVDIYGNQCRRLTIPTGAFTLRYDATAEVPDWTDVIRPDEPEVAPADLPDDALLFTLPSRYCPSDELADMAWDLFSTVEPGWGRVQAICDHVHSSITFRYGSSTPRTTAVDVANQGEGVCRDFAHLAVTLCRALTIPARYAFGYMPDIDVPISPDPMDFCAWFEVYLGRPGQGRWYTFDARNNEPRKGRVLIGRGRDALDVAMVTTYGAPFLDDMTVWADQVEEVAG